MATRLSPAVVVVAGLLMAARPQVCTGQQPPQPEKPTVDSTLEAGEAEAVEPRRRLVRWNEYEGPFFTIRVGGGVLVDYAHYSQDEASRQQFELTPAFKLRDARFLLKGRIKFKRPVTWSSGIMWDGASGKLAGSRNRNHGGRPGAVGSRRHSLLPIPAAAPVRDGGRRDSAATSWRC